MGFYSTFVTEDAYIEWPDWFIEKYKDWVYFKDNKSGLISSKQESKTYSTWEDLPEDIQKVLKESSEWDYKDNFILVYLHECGGITRCQINGFSITWSEPETWKEVDDVTHNYCYGCSDI